MNSKNAHQYLPLVLALIEGKTIEYNYDKDKWVVRLNIDTSFSVSKYRVALDQTNNETKILPTITPLH